MTKFWIIMILNQFGFLIGIYTYKPILINELSDFL